ncbi:zinc ribbon domain-containing protein [Natrinema sp. 1APR25-10V2]|uniref:double zinc ribbon domain-containing protein n=1 Tax=Natrinema sp. 1APR25-10V2 TaxID=2951081 RepID=UPI0028758A28|nr:zinc ribbon domain-containing protein [Natrinema sp. 1APR25-10V2]MDS0475436.1 ribbon-helix-helix protein, CopG family [Natrinema sp. 1APR25-10V2]
MSKITFRADDDLVDQLEALDASKSEAMREALRAYLEDGASDTDGADAEPDRDGTGAIDDLVREQVDERLEERLRELGLDAPDERSREPTPSTEPRDLDLTISLEGATLESDERVRIDGDRARKTADGNRPGDRSTGRAQKRAETQPRDRDGGRQCNQCGDHLDGDHVYCPNCGEKASRRLFCDCGDEIRSDWSFCPGCGRRTPAADVLESETNQY